jgi:signal transduction histidine kinase
MLNYDNGIGLKNMEDRVLSLNGNIDINVDNGFRIFISVPKSSKD